MNETIQLRQTRPLVLFHGGCRDGFAAAWAIHYALKDRDVEFVSAFHGTAPPDVHGREVIMVDFCYPRSTMELIAEDADSLLVLDHHKTAQAALEGFADAANAVMGAGAVAVVFDMNRSGAGITWDHFFSTTYMDGPSYGHPVRVARPWLIDYVEDRDLWRHALPGSEKVNAYISTLAFDFATWDAVNEKLSVKLAASLGEIAVAKTAQYVREVCKNAVMVEAWGHRVPCVNVPQVDVSEVHDHLLTKDHPQAKFSLAWWMRGDGLYQYSLRSRGDFDVSVLAQGEGGGGHEQAAGFERGTLAPFLLALP